MWPEQELNQVVILDQEVASLCNREFSDPYTFVKYLPPREHGKAKAFTDLLQGRGVKSVDAITDIN
jgi:hypothetical protein